MKDIEEGIIPVPKISVQAIQEVAMEKCGLSPEEVAEELLKLEKEPRNMNSQTAEAPAAEAGHTDG